MDLKSAFRQGMADEMLDNRTFRKFPSRPQGGQMPMQQGMGSMLYGPVEDFLYRNRPQQVMDAQMAAQQGNPEDMSYGGRFEQGQQMQGLQGIQRPEGMPQTLAMQFAPGEAPQAFQDKINQARQQMGQNQPPMLQGPRPMPAPVQSEPAAQQRVLNQDQRRQYNQLRREQGQGAAKDFRESVKAGESGLGNKRPNFRKR